MYRHIARYELRGRSCRFTGICKYESAHAEAFAFFALREATTVMCLHTNDAQRVVSP